MLISDEPVSLFQNNVLELWSLFDFLMPGFLGTEKQFYQRFGKPIILSRDAKSSSKEQEAGMENNRGEGGGIMPHPPTELREGTH